MSTQAEASVSNDTVVKEINQDAKAPENTSAEAQLTIPSMQSATQLGSSVADPAAASIALARPPVSIASSTAATRSMRHIIPAVPIVPALPPSPTATRRPHRDSSVSIASHPAAISTAAEDSSVRRESMASNSSSTPATSAEAQEPPKIDSLPVAPKSWADLVRSKGGKTDSNATINRNSSANSLAAPRNEALSDVLTTMTTVVEPPKTKIAFLKPRGLINTGNMCYMNSILQVLIFCIPFYDFLDIVSQRAKHSFKSDTPLMDAMIMFMKEYSIIDSANSPEKLQKRLKPEDYEQYGDPFVPEYVYNVIRQLPRFRDMRRGHQQDAQEFLGFLLEELHEECALAMRSGSSVNSGTTTPTGSISNLSEIPDTESGWMEVGHKQKAAITRSSGAVLTESPVTKIFGGKLRSELKVAGNKNSVTLEPFEALQLDVGAPQVTNVIEALKNMTKPESMQGDFNSPRGPKASATKQVYIESLPPILILHLKRFQYDNTTKKTEKIWREVGYPLDLEIPKEMFPQQARNKMAVQGSFPRYKLIAVIYHHGKIASGGHYTADVRRQEAKEWIRIDDTLIRRVRNEDIAKAGSEQHPKALAAALEKQNQHKMSNGNMFDQIDAEEDEEEDDNDQAWSQVNGHSRNRSTMSAVVNGSATPGKEKSGPQTPSYKSSIKDNKIAYLLFYQRV